MTLVRAVVAKALRDAATFNAAANTAPAAVLWADPERAWAPVIRSLQEAVPILVLGEYDRETAQGPALWLRAVLASPELAELPEHLADRDVRNPWVIYLPGVNRSSVAEAPALDDSLAPLAEIAIRSNWWPSAHGQAPWTPHSFFASKQGAGLDIAGDAATRAALTQVLDKFLFEDIDELKRMGRLDSSRLHHLVLDDSVRTLLEWMNDPDVVRASLEGPRWQALIASCKSDYGFNPEKDGALTAASKLGSRVGEWGAAWQRFAENPVRYPNIPGLLDQARPSVVPLFGEADPHPASWPSWNRDQEEALRAALGALATHPNPGDRVKELAAEHSIREDSVWADLGQAPLLRAVGHLAELADRVATASSAADLKAQVDWYGDEGHLIDDLALRAIASAKSAQDRAAVTGALGALYDPWVDQSARAFQKLAVNGYHGQTGLDLEAGTVAVYVDALRFDLAVRVARRLSPLVAVETRLAAFPSVTPTGQPAVAPIAITVGGGTAFDAADDQGRSLKGQVLRSVLASSGVKFLGWDAAEVGDPSGKAWTQTNSIDSLGHSHGHALADLIDQQLDLVAERVRGLLDAGWREVVVVTDHGFLLPGRPAQKVTLPLPMTEGDAARKPRVARLKAEAARPDFPILSWTWDSSVDMVSAPGSAAFEAGRIYEHGGLSLQECVIPVLTVTRADTLIAPVQIEAVRWTGQRCRIDFGPAEADVNAEIRVRPVDASSTVGGPKAPTDPGEIKVLVDEDAAPSGTAAWVVLLDSDGSVVAQKQTTVGGTE